MNATPSRALPQHLTVVLTLAHVLQRMEGSRDVGADQYRAVVQRLSAELGRLPADESLNAVLEAHPAAAQVYENLNYRHAGLCRSPLEQSMGTEVLARQAIERARRR